MIKSEEKNFLAFNGKKYKSENKGTKCSSGESQKGSLAPIDMK